MSTRYSATTARFTQAGFTLIEVLVVVAILAILVAITVVALRNYGLKQNFELTVVDVRDGVSEARQKTLASINDTMYGVHVSSTAVVFFDGVEFVEGYAGNETITLPDNITATTSFTNDVTTATFTRLTGTASATGTLTLTDTRSLRTATITIEQLGIVE